MYKYNSDKDYYKIINVKKNASISDIKQAYKKSVSKHHPDKKPVDKNSESKFLDIVEAYNILKDSNLRSQYDFFRNLKKVFD